MKRFARTHPKRRAIAALLASGLLLGGCLSPHRATRSADRTAYRIIKQKQQAALGKTEPFTLARPEDELRRRLMLDQKLPAAGPASFGREYLPPVPKEPAGVSENLRLPDEAVVVGTKQARTHGVKTETLATDVFLMDVGSDPENGAVSSRAASPVVMGPPAPSDWAPEPMVITLIDALQIAAQFSRDYQSQKESVFTAALRLDLERDAFEFRFSGTVDADIASELEGDDTTGVVISPALGLDKLFKSGARLTTRIGIDLAKLLSGSRAESMGTFADASITVPLLRGAGVEVVTENLQQAERDAVYAIWDFETFKREFAVTIVSEYLNVLGDLQSIQNSEVNYRSSQDAAVRAAALYSVGQLPGIQVSQATQNALQAQARLLRARQQYQSGLDSLKVRLGLPPDAHIELDPAELENLAPLAEAVLGPGTTVLPTLQRRDVPETRPGARPAGPATESSTTARTPPTTQPAPADPSSLPAGVLDASDEDQAAEVARFEQLTGHGIRLALRNRLDLAVVYAGVVDAQRQTVLTANALQGGLDLTAGAAYGGSRGALSGDQGDVGLRLGSGSYNGGMSVDLPIERTSERNSYRNSVINLDQAIRAAQQLEDQVKLDILNGMRDLRVTAQNLRIQAVSIEVGQRQVSSAQRFFEEGRGQVRDLTEAQNALINAQNSFIDALIGYRVAQLALQRDLGVLEVDAQGLFKETDLLQTAP